MTFRMLAALGLAAIATPWAVPGALAAQGYDGCAGFIDALPANISTPGRWCLRKDLSTAVADGVAINIAADNVTIDCNDFKVGGLAAGATTRSFGIHAGNRQDVTVRNCNVRGFERGINLSGGKGHLVVDNRLDGNVSIGVTLLGGEGLVRRNRIYDTGGRPDGSFAYGIYCDPPDGGHCDILDNIIEGVFVPEGNQASIIGITLEGGQGSRVARNQVRGLGEGWATEGINLIGATHTFLDDNEVVMATPAVEHGFAFACPDGAAALRGSTSWGFGVAVSPWCIDDGGNAAH